MQPPFLGREDHRPPRDCCFWNALCFPREPVNPARPPGRSESAAIMQGPEFEPLPRKSEVPTRVRPPSKFGVRPGAEPIRAFRPAGRRPCLPYPGSPRPQGRQFGRDEPTADVAGSPPVVALPVRVSCPGAPFGGAAPAAEARLDRAGAQNSRRVLQSLCRGGGFDPASPRPLRSKWKPRSGPIGGR